MRAVTRAARSLLVAASVLALAVLESTPAAAGGGRAWTGACNPYVDGNLIPVPCSAGLTNTGHPGSAGSSSDGVTVINSCAATVLNTSQAQSLGLPWPPPTGNSWALLLCFAGVLGAGPQAILVDDASGVPAITPQQLSERAYGELHVPQLTSSTAPPRGRDGLVGLPEWFWIAARSWRARTVTVRAGPVWATVTATPVDLTFRPGPGLSPVTCTGPGTAYNPAEPSTTQQTDCSYTYLAPSTGQPANAYAASVTVTWRVTWIGSGGAGGLLDANLPVSEGFSVPVAQGEGLVTSP